MNMFPFFIECSKHYQDEPHKQKFLQKLAFGHGIHIIKRKDKRILVTPNGEFVIPAVYSDKALRDLSSKLWEVNDFTRLGDCIEGTRRTWHTARKKDKIYLLYKYVASLPNLTRSQKMAVCNVLILALLLKMILQARIINYGFTLALPATLLTCAALTGWIPARLDRRGSSGLVPGGFSSPTKYRCGLPPLAYSCM